MIMKTKRRLPNGHRFVKQNGYKRGWYHNWAIFDKDGNMLCCGGFTKQGAKELYYKESSY